MTPATFRAAYGLTYQFDAGLAEPVHCTFTDTEDGPALEAAFVGGKDIYNEGKSALITEAMVKRIESAAFSHLERQAEQINAERRYERRVA
jgi:hypothetical protein